MRPAALIVLSTAPDEATAERISRALVEERLAACVNATKVRSTYRWEGKVQGEDEVLLVMKTSADRRTALESRLRELHPYAVPEVVALDAATASTPYLDWILESTRP